MTRTFAIVALLLSFGAEAGEPTLKPFVLASREQGEVEAVAAATKAKVEAAGFEVVGTYSPYPGAVVLSVTSDALKTEGARTETGGYAAAQRVSITKVGEEVQVAFTNPRYIAAAYRLAGNLVPIATALEGALGRLEEYGPADGKTAKDLSHYHYMVGMQYFDEPSTLAKYATHAEAVDAVEAGLAARRGGASKVYRIDLPGGTQTVFGVALTDGCSGDAFIMKEIDFKPLRSTAHLPYELLVAGGNVYALHARFRIALNFPDLKMMGSHSFMNIRCAPGAIEGALKSVAATTR